MKILLFFLFIIGDETRQIFLFLLLDYFVNVFHCHHLA